MFMNRTMTVSAKIGIVTTMTQYRDVRGKAVKCGPETVARLVAQAQEGR